MFNMFVAFPLWVLVKIRKTRSILWRCYHVNGSFGEAGSSKHLPTTDPKSSNVQCPMSRRHGLMAVADFLTSYLPENDQLHLSRRFVEVGMCPWDSMFLLGELMMFWVLTHPFMNHHETSQIGDRMSFRCSSTILLGPSTGLGHQ